LRKLFIIVNVDWFFLSHRKEIALAAQKDGYSVTIVTNNTGMKSVIEGLGLKVIDLPMSRSGMNLIQELSTFKYLYKLYKREKPDVVHHVGLKAILWGTLAAKFAKVSGVLNAVSGLGIFFAEDSESVLSKIFVQVFRYSHHRNNLAVIFQNDDDKSLFLTKGIIRRDQAYIIKGSGVDLEQFCYTPEPVVGSIKILLTARMIPEKGIFILVEAANLLKKAYKDKVQFLLCGGIDDNPTAITKEEIKVVCDGKYISWLGYRTDVLELIKSSHIVVLPSYYKEGLPKSLIEAAAVGRPIITTDSVGCREAVVENYNGFLVPVRNSRILADKLKILIDSPKLRRSFGKNSRLFAERDYSISDVIKKHLNVYSDLMGF
jgi:glycosyltransferase involved in cell wall biosynthesis